MVATREQMQERMAKAREAKTPDVVETWRCKAEVHEVTVFLHLKYPPRCRHGNLRRVAS
jgi:hypothetical protein